MQFNAPEHKDPSMSDVARQCNFIHLHNDTTPFWLKAQVFRLEKLKLGTKSLCLGVVGAMPLSEEQNKLLKTNETTISFRDENPKKPGSKAWERFEKYKKAKTIGEATTLGAQWQDISADFEKEFLTFADVDMPVLSKRSAPDGTPDKEAKARSRPRPAQVHEGAVSAPSNQEVANTQLEMSAATISILRTMMRESYPKLSIVYHPSSMHPLRI